MSDEARDTTVVVQTRTTIKSETYGDIKFDVDDDGSLNIGQDTDRIYMTRASSIALAKVILQHHQVGFEPVYHEEVDYSA